MADANARILDILHLLPNGCDVTIDVAISTQFGVKGRKVTGPSRNSYRVPQSWWPRAPSAPLAGCSNDIFDRAKSLGTVPNAASSPRGTAGTTRQGLMLGRGNQPEWYSLKTRYWLHAGKFLALPFLKSQRSLRRLCGPSSPQSWPCRPFAYWLRVFRSSCRILPRRRAKLSTRQHDRLLHGASPRCGTGLPSRGRRISK